MKHFAVGLTLSLMGILVAGCSVKPAPAPAPAVGPVLPPGGAGAGPALQLGVSDLRDTGVPGLLPGLDPDGRFVVAFGPEPEYWLTLTRLDAPEDPVVVAKVATAAAAVVPGTGLIAFIGAEKSAAGNQVYVVNSNGSGLTTIGATDTPYDLQTTARGLVAFRSGSALTVYDTAAGESRRLDGVVLTGEYGLDNAEWAISPDGNRLALLDGRELTLLDLPTGTRRTVPGAPGPERQTLGAWSADGSLFAYGSVAIDLPGEPTLWVASPEAAARPLLSPSRAGIRDLFEAIRWLDGATMLVSFVPHGPKPEAYSGTRYFAVSLDGRTEQLFTGGSGLFVAADGKTIYFQRPTKEMYTRRPTIWTGQLRRSGANGSSTPPVSLAIPRIADVKGATIQLNTADRKQSPPPLRVEYPDQRAVIITVLDMLAAAEPVPDTATRYADHSPFFSVYVTQGDGISIALGYQCNSEPEGPAPTDCQQVEGQVTFFPAGDGKPVRLRSPELVHWLTGGWERNWPVASPPQSATIQIAVRAGDTRAMPPVGGAEITFESDSGVDGRARRARGTADYPGPRSAPPSFAKAGQRSVVTTNPCRASPRHTEAPGSGRRPPDTECDALSALAAQWPCPSPVACSQSLRR